MILHRFVRTQSEVTPALSRNAAHSSRSRTFRPLFVIAASSFITIALQAQSTDVKPVDDTAVVQKLGATRSIVLQPTAVVEGDSVTSSDGGCSVTVEKVWADSATIKVALDRSTPAVFRCILARERITMDGNAGLYTVGIERIRGKLVDLAITLRKKKR